MQTSEISHVRRSDRRDSSAKSVTASRSGGIYRNVFFKTLSDGRRGTFFFSLGLFACGFLMAVLYPSINDTYAQMIEAMPEFLSNFVSDFNLGDTPEGYLTIELFSFTAPVITMGFAIRRGMLAISGEEEGHTLDQLMANPVSRSEVIVQKSLSMMTSCTVLVVSLAVSLLIGAAVADFSIDISGLIHMHVSLLLVTWAIGFTSIAAGAASGKNSIAFAVPATVAAYGFLIDFVEPSSDLISFADYISVMHYYVSGDPFLNGINYWHAAVLAAISVFSFIVASRRFNARDLR